ncbi:hypothetical protein Lal_00000976 [Lupinus albus]|nr:hypothetical protein Lal_00000976 [Lupinus albus]
MDGKLFLEVGGLDSDGSPLGDCNNELWISYYSTEMYKSCLREQHYFVQGELTKVESMTVENRLLRYINAYILVHQNTNHAQPNDNDLKLIVWMYQEDYQTTVEIYDEEEDVILAVQNQAPQLDEASNMPQKPSFGLAHLDAIEKNLNECIDNRIQAMEDRHMIEF